MYCKENYVSLPWRHPKLQEHLLCCVFLRLGNIAEVDLGIAPPVMKSFKEFLLSLEDSVDETEAVKRYNDYKLDFRRQQMQDFFLAHKDEEWYVSHVLGPFHWLLEGGRVRWGLIHPECSCDFCSQVNWALSP